MANDRTLNIRPPLWLPIVVALLAGGAYITGKVIETRGYQPLQISVSGTGRVFATPDVGDLSFGVQTGRQPTAQQAMERLSRDMDNVLNAVKALGIEEKDIRTESLWLNPAYDWIDGRQVSRGFEASQSVRVKVRDLDKIGKVLSVATGAGANQAGGVSFTIDDPEVLKADAREKAIVDAKEKAKELAAQLGKRIVKMKAYAENESGVPSPMPYIMMDRGMGGGGGDAALPSGEQEVVVQVYLTYELQ